MIPINVTVNNVILHNLDAKYEGSFELIEVVIRGSSKVPIVSGRNLINSENNKATDKKPNSLKLEKEATINIVPLLFTNPIIFWIQFFDPKASCFFNRSKFTFKVSNLRSEKNKYRNKKIWIKTAILLNIIALSALLKK